MTTRTLHLIRVATLVATAAAIPTPRVWAANAYRVLHTFSYGSAPQGALARDAAGNIYGTTGEGGYHCLPGDGCGIVWKLSLNPNGTWTSGVIHAFLGPDGAYPVGGVITDAAGNLYGTTREGGDKSVCPTSNSYGCGTVFELSPNKDGKWIFSELHQFELSDGAFPVGRLTFDAAGNLYGTTEQGGTGSGVVFRLELNSGGTWTESIIHNFTGTDGDSPQAGVTFDKVGNLYGTTTAGGANSGGTVFKLAPNSEEGTWTESVLYSFYTLPNGADGWAPTSDLTFDMAGNLYGTTRAGGTGPYVGGTVFKLALKPGGDWTESVLHSFKGGAPGLVDGNSPEVGVTFDATGNLYGTTYAGGLTGDGIVFKLTPATSSWDYAIIHEFSGLGARPLTPILLDPAGHLYGTTWTGSSNPGLVFEITP